MDNKAKLKEINRKIIIVQILDSPGAIMLGFGLYAKYAADGDAFLPILNNQTVVNVMIGFGAALTAWGAYKVTTLSLQKKKLLNK